MRRILTMLAVTGVVAASLVATFPDATADPASAPFRPDPTAAAPATVTLPTGDRVQWSADATGRQSVLVLPRPGTVDDAYLTLRIAGDEYVLPRSALPQLAQGGRIDAFDVTAQAQHRATPTAGPGDARFPMRTMRVTGIDELGQPAAGLAMFYLIVNVDNGNRFAYFSSMATGYRNLSVPVGHYCVIGFFSRQDKQTGAFDDRIVTLPELTVPERPGVTAVTLDGRAATNSLTVNTPRPASRQIQDVQVDRSDEAATGDVSLGYELIGTRDTISVNATQPDAVQHGRLHFYTTWRLAADDGSYTYDLEYPAEGYVPDRAAYTVTDQQLATVDAAYDANVTGGQGIETRYSFLPWQSSAIRVGSGSLRAPLRRIEYIIGDPQIVWVQQIEAVFSIFTEAGAVSDSYRRYQPGEHSTQHWSAPPIGPGVQADLGANPGGAFVCTACREGNTLRLLVYPFGDNEVGHVGARDGIRPGSQLHETTDFAIYQGTTQLADATQALGSIDLPADASTYHLVYDNTRSAPWWTLSTHVRTEWTFTSSATDGTGTLPRGWTCGPDGGTDCGIVPLLFARYDLPTDDLGALDGDTVTFTVDHAQGAAPSPITATLDASYDGGTTWAPAPVTTAGDTFTAHLDVPAQTDGYLALRLNAADQDGSALDQTVIRAAAISAAPAAVSDVQLGAPDTTTPAPATITPACDDGGPQRATCFALIHRAPAGPAGLTPMAAPSGYGPADLQSAYSIAADAAQRGDGQTVAIVDAYDSPTAEADLAVYRAQFGLPPCASADGCFTKLNQRGGTDKYPRADYGWASEISLDLDMVSAACPRCRIVLVEADSNAVSNLAAAAETAAGAGANVISNSYGTDEFTGMDAYAAAYRHPGVFVTASSGDAGFTFPQFPAVLPDIAAVGGTSLHRSPDGTWTEQAWGNGVNSLLGGGASSGCSGYIAKPAWQHDQDCLMRTTSDLAAVADPNTGVAVYDTAVGQRGWIVIGGTSAASPLVAGMIGLAGNAATLTIADIYHDKHAFHDVVGGSVGYCDDAYICTGGKGYDGPTGLGSPDGINGL